LKHVSMKVEILIFMALNAVLSILLALAYLFFVKEIFDIQLIYAFAAVFLVFMAISYLYLNKKFNALHCLIEFASSHAHKRTEIPICDGSYEVKNLRDAMLELIDINEYLCKQKQELLKEVAHELKSPLGVLKARLALYEQQENSSKADFIDAAKEDISIITSKLKELLFLKSIEWDMQQQKVMLNMEDNCKVMQEIFAPILMKKNVGVDAHWEEGFIIFTYKEAMLKVIQAIFENIFIHTKANSTIIVNAKPNVIKIKNEIDFTGEGALFSSHIGIKMIQRLSSKLSYEYTTKRDEKYFYTTLTLFDQKKDECAI
jgi:signal transduction histidine kinase